MRLEPYLDDLHRQLAVAAAVGDDLTRERAELLIAPLDSAARLVLLEALSAAAGEITVALAPGSVEVRLRGGDPEFVVTPAPAERPAAQPVERPAAPDVTPGPAVPEPAGNDGATTRTTLRLPDRLKARAEAAAEADGVSVNTWLVRAVAAAVDRREPGRGPAAAPAAAGGQRLTGWVR